MRFVKYLVSSYLLNIKISLNTEKMDSENFEIQPAQEIAFRTAIIEKYLKERNKSYDFLHLGETEELNII